MTTPESLPDEAEWEEPGVSEDEPTVTAHNSSPDRTVFMEADNVDGWISTDLVVDLRR